MIALKEQATRTTTKQRAKDQREEEFYSEEYAHFTADRSAALAYMDNGAHEWDRNLNSAELAALGVVVNSIMNTTEAYMKK